VDCMLSWLDHDNRQSTVYLLLMGDKYAGNM